MSDSIFSDTDRDSGTLQLELGGRRFPQSWSPSEERDPTPVHRLAESPAAKQLPGRIEETLRKRLAWISLPPETADVPTLVRAYNDSLNQLDGFRADIEKLVRAACLANLEFRQEAGPTHMQARDAAMDAKLDEMLREAAYDWLPTKNLISGALISQPSAIVRPRLHDSLQEAVHQLVAGFFEMLAKLVDRQLFGLVEWFPNHCCDYHFFKRVIIQNVEDSYDEVHRTFGSWEEAAFGQRVVGRETTVNHSFGVHTHRLARHVHIVTKAIRTSVGNSRVVMPLAVTQMLKAIPDWLYPFVEVIEGEIVREQIIEQDTLVENWQQSFVVRNDPIIVRDEPIYGCEPAVLIGPYVLTGWGPREIDAELKRREDAKATAAAATSRQIAAGSGPLFAVAAIALAPVALVQGGVLLAVAAGGAAWQAASDFFTLSKHRDEISSSSRKPFTEGDRDA